MERYHIRILAVTVLLISASSAILAAGNAGSQSTSQLQMQSDNTSSGFGLPNTGTGDFGSKSSLTVITGDSVTPANEPGVKKKADLVVVDASGKVIYRNSTYDKYWDIDPVPETQYTVIYAASIHLESCYRESKCDQNVVVRHNLSTDQTEVLFERKEGGRTGYRYHDVDRLSNGDLLIADIANDRVFQWNTTTQMTTWSWNAQRDLPTSSGGPFPDDWTHINDVERLEDDRIMVSLRNQDRVVFLNSTNGTIDRWTLGAEDERDILFEQHNPDYIPSDRGGPSVLVADSENNRVVEYQRTNDSWEQSWTWQDTRMQWPRDADRLPNGHTLVTDSNGNRVLEINTHGEIVWSLDFAFPYEAERLGTGDESSGGSSAVQLGLTGVESGNEIDSHTAKATNESSDTIDSNPGIGTVVKNVLPGRIVNIISYVLPPWISPVQLLVLLAATLIYVLYVSAELWKAGYRAKIKSPISISRPKGGE